MKHFASFIKSGAAVAALSLVPAFAQAATVTTPGADTYTIGAISENGMAVADAALYSLDAMDTFDFIGFGADGGDVSGFEAEQEFTNNTGNDVVFSASTILLTTEVTGAYLYADVGGTLYDLGGSGTFSVADGDNFTIIWGASDITGSSHL